MIVREENADVDLERIEMERLNVSHETIGDGETEKIINIEFCNNLFVRRVQRGDIKWENRDGTGIKRTWERALEAIYREQFADLNIE